MNADKQVDARSKIIRKAISYNGPVIYWMERDKRLRHNWALSQAIRIANEQNQPFLIVSTILKGKVDLHPRKEWFLVHSIHLLSEMCKDLGISFIFYNEDPINNMVDLVNDIKVSVLITDFNPLLEKQQAIDILIKKTSCGIIETDAHNCVPYHTLSDKQEFGAYTIRPKFYKLETMFRNLPNSDFSIPKSIKSPIPTDWNKILKNLKTPTKQFIEKWHPGEEYAYKLSDRIVQSIDESYATNRNDPTLYAQTDLSPYINAGLVSAQYISSIISSFNNNNPGIKTFIEELLVRR